MASLRSNVGLQFGCRQLADASACKQLLTGTMYRYTLPFYFNSVAHILLQSPIILLQSPTFKYDNITSYIKIPLLGY